LQKQSIIKCVIVEFFSNPFHLSYFATNNISIIQHKSNNSLLYTHSVVKQNTWQTFAYFLHKAIYSINFFSFSSTAFKYYAQYMSRNRLWKEELVWHSSAVVLLIICITDAACTWRLGKANGNNDSDNGLRRAMITLYNTEYIIML